MKELSANLKAIIEGEAKNFKNPTEYLYNCYYFLDIEPVKIKIMGEVFTNEFFPSAKFFKKINNLGPYIYTHFNNLAPSFDTHFKNEFFFKNGIFNQEFENFLNSNAVADIVAKCFAEAGFAEATIQAFACFWYKNKGQLSIEVLEKKYDTERKFPIDLFKSFSLLSYLIFKLYENFDNVSLSVNVEPEKLFYDLWLMGDSLKKRSHFLIGYWTKARDAKNKPILSAKTKSTQAEQEI